MTQIILTDTSSANANITATTQITLTLTDTSSANTNITAATQIAHTDTSSANSNTTAATQITLTDTFSANANITATTQITLTDTSSADTKITAATQITLSDTSSADTNITAAPQITLTDTSSANINITAATQITLTDTSSSNANITTATQITPTDTSSANTNPTAATNSQFDTLSGPLRTRSPLWRALRRSRRRLRTVANGCGRKRKTWRTQPHPQTPKWNGNPRYAFGKNRKNPTGKLARNDRTNKNAKNRGKILLRQIWLEKHSVRLETVGREMQKTWKNTNFWEFFHGFFVFAGNLQKFEYLICFGIFSRGINKCWFPLSYNPIRLELWILYNFTGSVTYGPHKAVAEVSNHNEPIGRKSGIQLARKSMDFTFNSFVLNWLTD